ncbi:hypothetical protein [Bordetella petrii]|uniref:hypothetical protein n=1 Tax=Bordetella petrii TaxID=94624 RepID=UPI00047C6F0F|nr:hypothetical protein [Bordetella petrii]
MVIVAKLRNAWRGWGERGFVGLGVYWLLYQVCAAWDASEQLGELMEPFEHLQLDELLLSTALVFPALCAALWWRTRKLQQELFRRAVADTVANMVANRYQQGDAPTDRHGACTNPRCGNPR